MAYKKKRYWVNFYCNGFCYRSVSDADWEGVKRYKKLAKLLGETITYEEM